MPRPDGLDHTKLTITRLVRRRLRVVGIEVDDDLVWGGDRLIVPLQFKPTVGVTSLARTSGPVRPG